MLCTSRRDAAWSLGEVVFVSLGFAIVWTPAYFLVCALFGV